MHPVLQQVQWNAERDAKLFVQPEFFETEEVFPNVFGKITADELFATIIECASAICAGTPVKSRTKKLGVVRAHTVMHASKFCSKSLNVILDVRVKSL